MSLPPLRLHHAAIVAACLASVVPASAAPAATLVPDQACYAARAPVQFAGSGFGASDPINLSGEQIFKAGNADASGAFTVTTLAPLLGTTTPGSKTFTVTATDQTTQVSAAAKIKVANAAFAISSGIASATTRRTWTFSGLFQRPGKPIYGHFRFKGRTRSNHRFGVPSGVCGELKAKAPLIPGTAPIPGKWSIQIDFEKRYNRFAKPRLTNTATVFHTIG